MKKDWKIGTKAVQGNYEPENSQPRVLPIYQSTTYKYNSANEVAKLFDLEVEGHMYSRISNPTVEEFEKKMSLLENGVDALATASGQSAILLAVMTICKTGDHIVASSTIYGGTYTLFSTTLKKFGIEVTFVDPSASEEEIIKCFTDKTKLLFGETIGNPGLNVLDFQKFSNVSQKMDVPLVIDNTFATPYLCRPFEYGAHIVIHSATKYIDGHATSIGGVIIDSGRFNWDNGKNPDFVEPDKAYHGISYVKDFKEKAFIKKCRSQLMRDFGPTLSAFNAFIFHTGLETLHLRMERHSKNALKLAKHLQNHNKVNWVNYPLLENHNSYNLAKKYLPKGASGVLTFGIKGGTKAGINFIDNVKLTKLVIHVGDLRTSVLHPASTTHRQLSEEEQIASGVFPDLIRVSVGIEDIEDIIEDFDQALEKC